MAKKGYNLLIAVQMRLAGDLESLRGKQLLGIIPKMAKKNRIKS